MQEIVSFSQFYNDINEMKKPSFRQFVNGVVDDLKLVKNYTLNDKPQFSNVDKQRAKFVFMQESNFTGEADSEQYNKRWQEFKKFHEGIAKLLGLHSKPKQYEREHRSIEGYEYKETLKDGYEITYRSELYRNYLGMPIRDTFEITGKEAKAGNTEFEEFPEYKPGTILVATYGYSMVLVSFYQIVKRSGKTIYSKELEQKITGDNWRGHATPIKDKFKSSNFITSRLPDPKVDGHYARIWDGKPKYYDHMD